LTTYKECVRRQDASCEPLAASVGPTGWSVAVRKKKKHLTSNFAHAQPRLLWTDCNQILRGVRWAMWSLITDAKFYGNGVSELTGPPKRHFLYLTFIALTTVSALPCCTVIYAALHCHGYMQNKVFAKHFSSLSTCWR